MIRQQNFGICCIGIGNTSSIANMIKKTGGNPIKIFSPNEIQDNVNVLVIPGVGSFDYAMDKLHKSHWTDLIYSHIESNKFVLGICLGMQLLCESSEEGQREGLKIIPGKFIKFRSNEKEKLKVPHMGWNEVKYDSKMPFKIKSNGERNNYRYYFVHSYKYSNHNNDNVYALTKYGVNFPSVIGKNNGRIIGVQFHPEKSHMYGIDFFTNYIRFLNNA